MALAASEITADELAAKQWKAMITDNYDNVRDPVTFSITKAPNGTLSGAIVKGSTCKIIQVVLNGNKLTLTLERAQDCSKKPRVKTWKIKWKSSKQEFVGTVGGPKSRCRGGTFSEDVVAVPL